MSKNLCISVFDSFEVIPIVRISEKKNLTESRERKLKGCSEDVKIVTFYDRIVMQTNGVRIADNIMSQHWLLFSVRLDWKDLVVYGVMIYRHDSAFNDMEFTIYRMKGPNTTVLGKETRGTYSDIDVTQMFLKYAELGDFVG